jgi:hypothetical protein
MEINTITLNKSRFITRDIQVVIGDETLNATVRPLGITMETQSRLLHFDEVFKSDDASSETIENALSALPCALSELVVEWDLTMNGEAVPTTIEAIRSIPMDVLQVLITSIQEEANASPLEETSTS